MTETREASDGSAGGRGAGPGDWLARRNDELEAVLAIARLGFCRLESESGPVSANTQFKAEFGWPPDAVLDFDSLRDRLASEDRTVFEDAVRESLGTGRDLELTVRARWPTGTVQWLALQGRGLDAGERRVLVLTCRNVSAMVARESQHAAALEEQRGLRIAAQAANRGKDEFLSVFSHELRSPLNAILGWNRLLKLKRAGDAEVCAATARIEHSARAQLKLVNDLLDLGRIETGKLRIEARPMQLAQVAAAAVDLARPSAAAKSVRLDCEIEPGAGQLRADPDRLHQVVANLLSNAVKFTPAGGRILVRIRDIGRFTELTVRDTGQGIPAQLLPHVFDRFRQGDNSSTRHSGGLGIGLALVREIVSLHGGEVSASSGGVGQGAQFVARFPVGQSWRTREDDGHVQESPAVHRSLGGLSILVVDDEPDARTVVAETLRLEGARVTMTDSAGSAFAKLQEQGAHFDMLVSDIGMPVEDGYSLVRRLRSLESGRQMLAIAVTGYASRSDVAAAMDAGFDLHVPKPVDFNTFVPLVRRLAASAVPPPVAGSDD